MIASLSPCKGGIFFYNGAMNRLLPLWLLLLLFSCHRNDPFDYKRQPLNEWDSVQRMSQDITGLNSPVTEGRLSGSDGFDRAAEYAAFQFQESGLLPAPFLDHYYQYFSLEAPSPDPSPRASLGRTPLRAGDDFVVALTSEGASLTQVPLIFVGYGLAEGVGADNEYLNCDVTGKVVLLLHRLPPALQSRYPRYSIPAYRSYIAKNRGALGVIFLDTEAETAAGCRNFSYIPPGLNLRNFPQLIAGRSFLMTLLQQDGIDLIAVKNDIDQSRIHYPLELQSRFSLSLSMEWSKKRSMNIVGYLPADPRFSDPKHLVFTAQLDGLGTQGKDLYYENALHNVSGAVTLLNLARLIAAVPAESRKADISFILLSGSEQGYAGAHEITETLFYDTYNTEAVISLDATGAASKVLHVEGGLDHPALYRRIEEARDLLYPHLPLTVSKGSYGEGQFFSNLGIPALYIMGETGDVRNTLSDTSSLIDEAAITRNARILFFAFYDLLFEKP